MTAQRLVSELPHARLRLISDAGHHLPRRAPGAVAEAIAGFVAALDETAPAARVILRHIPPAPRNAAGSRGETAGWARPADGDRLGDVAFGGQACPPDVCSLT
jgi:hypothetical protein